MKLPASAAAVLLATACGSSASPTTPQTLTFTRYSPAQPTGNDVLLAARGDVIVMAHRISRDAGATWSPLDARIGELKNVAVTGSQLLLYGSTSKLARWDVAAATLTPVAGAPSYTTDRNWRATPAGAAIVFDMVENALAVEGGGTWTTGALPQPSATETRPYIKDIESNGTVLLSASAWGVHRSTNGGATWTLAASAIDARDVLVLADHRFVVLNASTALLFDSSGAPAGTLPSLTIGANEATVCEDGAIVARDRVTTNLGATWTELAAAGDIAMQVQRAGCGAGRYWVLALSDVWGYRFVRYDGLGAPAIATGNWDSAVDQPWTSGGPPIVRTADGTFLVGGLALAPGSTDWTLRLTPARTWASGTTLFGVQAPAFYTSTDGGASWTASPATGLTVTEPEAFARTPDGALHVSQFTGTSADDGTDTWRAQVWRSTDAGAAWSTAYDGVATRGSDDKLVGESHRFVGIAPDGTWIATDAVSHDAGATWKTTGVKGDKGLAHLTLRGTLVTGGADEKLWRVYDDGGLGELRATYEIEVNGNAVPASQLRSVAFDEQGFAYVARGTPYVQIWRSDRSLDPE